MIPALFLILVAGSSSAGAPPAGSRAAVLDETFRDYRISVIRDSWASWQYQDTLVIAKDGKSLYTQQSFDFHLGGFDPADEKQKELLAVGKDITGNGIPDLVISEYTGGAHCCFLAHVFELGQHFRKLGTLDARDGDLSHFEDLDGDGNLEFVTNDFTFAYWHASFADSPAPRVVLKYRDGGYHVAPDLMRRPPPPKGELERRSRDVLGAGQWNARRIPSSLWATMLDLLYTGHPDLAWTFLNASWPRTPKERDDFRRELLDQLDKSPYAREIPGVR